MAASEVHEIHISQAVYLHMTVSHTDFQLSITVISVPLCQISITKPDKTVGRLRKILVLNPQMILWTTDNYAQNVRREE